MIKPEVLDAMVAAGCTAEQIAAAVKADMGNRSTNAERQARFRAKQKAASVTNNVTNVTERNVTGNLPPKETSPTPPKEITPIPSSEARASSLNARDAKSGFEVWYQHYPHKVQRGAAERAFVKALSLASLEELIAGVHRYVASKPADRQWQNPATWLNGIGWLDAPAAVVPHAATSPPGRRPNAVEANIARRIKRNEPASGRCDYRDAELLPPDKPELRALVGNLGEALAWGDG